MFLQALQNISRDMTCVVVPEPIILHTPCSFRRYKTWQTAYETIMLKYMDLCVQLQQHRQAKDGLHQYRNMAQQQAPASLEVGGVFFLLCL